MYISKSRYETSAPSSFCKFEKAPAPFSMGTDASVWLARTEQCLEQNGIPRDRGTSVARSFLSDDAYVQLLSIAREADLANQLFPTDAAQAAVVRATAEDERVQPTPSLDEETADSRCAVSVVRADTSSDIDRLVEALRRVLTEEIRDSIMPPHQQHRRAYHRPTAARPRELRCYNCGGRRKRFIRSGIRTAHHNTYRRIIDEMLPSVEELDAHSRNALRFVLWKYRRCIATSDEDLGHTELASHRIDARNAAPVKVPPRRLPPTQRHDVQRMVTDMFSWNVIGPANSPWSAPIVMVRMKDGSLRFCVDFRRLNDVTVKDAYPSPRIDDTLEALSGALDEADRLKTAFSTPFELYQFHAPATFQRLMDVALRGLTWSSCLAYLDGIIVFGRKAQEHTDRPFGARVAAYSGGRSEAKTSKMTPNAEDRTLPWSRSIRERYFHGRRKDPRGEGMADTLLPVGSSSIPQPCVVLSPFHQKFFNGSCPVECAPPKRLPLEMDGRFAEGVSAVLSQLSHGNERVVAYASRTLTKFERRYCVTRNSLMSALTIAACVGYATTKSRRGRLPAGSSSWPNTISTCSTGPAEPGRADASLRQRCPQCGISIVAAAALPVATMEKVAPSRCLSIFDIQTWLKAQSTDPTLSVLRSWLASDW
ncbi:Retrovirus-related Pol polyprotein from transposon 17.6 [Trichinella nelsoni]|uniref:Retrovirus-related Pol polyprotein from transposon 17.6 n=1 Tax=Trichinella nelsoni TaxID=6336 RepID=A0A0V0RVE2_9BILA|nr:Retrovirus-related Pol polyprotein from transposon 17.6 [Trichinella nelsoni]